MKKVLALVLVLAVMLPVMASADIATKLQGSTYLMEGHLEESAPLTATYNLVTGLEEKPQWVGNRYYNGDGSFATGWKKIGGYWYYFDPATGVKVTNKWIGSDKGGWYYLMNNGQMAVSTWVGDYYVNKNGKWIPNYGKSVEGWKHNGKGYWYDNGVGGYYTGWHKIGSSAFDEGKAGWYYFNDAGYMVRNVWVGSYYVGNDGCMYADMEAQVAGTWYAFDKDGRIYAKASTQAGLWDNNNYNHMYGQLLTRDGSEGLSTRHYNYDGTRSVGWYKTWDTGDWFYFNATGDMLTDQWVGDYYVGSDGAMWKNAWVGAYYVDGSGKKVTSKWLQLDGDWYYFKADGTLKKNAWEGDYYLGPQGKMLRNQWVGEYYVGDDGKWVP